MPLVQHKNVYIDPENCGSTVGYRLHIEEYTPKDKKTEHSLSATVTLADCNHMIDWDFSPGSLEKIDAAIHLLQEFRKKYFEAKKMIDALNK